MKNRKYKLLVIDDQWSSRETLYEKVLGGEDGPFELDPVINQSDLEEATRERGASAYVLDLFLEDNGWKIPAADVMENYIRPNRQLPVFLVSSLWDDPRVQAELDRLRHSNDLIEGFFTWRTFEGGETDAQREEIAKLRSEFRIRLDDWHRQSPIDKPDSEPIRILHLSDTQFRDPATDPYALNVEESMRYRLHTQGLRPDLIILSGDIAYSGRPAEYEAASKWIERLVQKFWPGDGERAYDRIFLVPGNHDVDLGISALSEFCYSFRWDKHDEDASPFQRLKVSEIDRGQEQLAFESFLQFSERYDRDRQWREGSNHLSRVSNRFAHWGIQLVLANTAAHIDARHPSRAGVPRAVIESITDRTAHADTNHEPYRVLVSHHGPKEWCHKEWPQEDWEHFDGLIGNSQIMLWLSGHRHGFRKQDYDEFSQHPGLRVVLAPCLMLNAEAREKDTLRGFVLIELERDDDGNVTGSQVHPFEFVGHKARPLQRT